MWWVLLQYFGGDGCDHTNAFVGVTIGLSVLVTLLSVIKSVQNGALLPSAVIVAYATYLVTVAVIGIPEDNSSTCVGRHGKVSSSGKQGVYSVGVILTILSTGYATIRAASTGQSLNPVEREAVAENGKAGQEDETFDDEEEGTQYRRDIPDENPTTVMFPALSCSYSFFHIVYALGAMHLAMVLNDWQISINAGSSTLANDNPWTGTWVNIGSQWACFAIYFWSLVAPLVCRGRDFS